jgi:hypothetical protein
MAQHDLGSEEITIYKGENKTFCLTVLDGNRDAYNLTGATLTLTVRPEICDNRVTFTKVSTDTDQIEIQSPPTDGLAHVKFVPADTEDLDHGTYAYDVWITLPSGNTQIIITPSPCLIKPPIRN